MYISEASVFSHDFRRPLQKPATEITTTTLSALSVRQREAMRFVDEPSPAERFEQPALALVEGILVGDVPQPFVEGAGLNCGLEAPSTT